MRKEFFKSVFKIILSYSIYFLCIEKVLEVPFVPWIATFLKSNYFIIGFIGVLGVFILFLRKQKWRQWSYILVSSFFVIIIGIRIFFLAGYYSNYYQKFETKISDKYFILKTYEPGFIPICATTNSVVKKRFFIFIDNIYQIGCRNYQIFSVKSDSILIILNEKDLFTSKIKSDTVSIKIE